MTAFPHSAPLSVEEYFKLDNEDNEARYEYVDGQIVMLAGGTPNHAKISANLIGILYSLLVGHACSVYTSDVRVSVSSTRYLHPDISVSCDERDQEQEELIEYPCLVIEVLSPSTEARDRGRKLAYYRNCPSIREYALVDPNHPSIELFRRERGNLWTYRVFGPGDEVEFTSLGVRFSATSIYRNIALPPEPNSTP